jgi:hypothetical protein
LQNITTSTFLTCNPLSFFKAVRNMDDLECMACPPKYRHIATFYKYYSGQLKPPYPTLFSAWQRNWVAGDVSH